MSLKQKIAGGIIWTALDLLVNKGFGFLIKLFLARLLFPSDYGLIGMAIVFISFAKVISDGGIGKALIHLDEEQISRSHLDTTFWVSVGWSILLFLGMTYLVAPWASQFYDEPMLNRIIPVLSISMLISPLNVVHRAQLARSFRFKEIAIINNTASLISGIIAVVLALLGFGVWTLVWYNILPLVIMLPQLFRATGYIPGFDLSQRAFRDVYSFGVTVMGTAIISTFINQLDYLLVGKMVSKYALGLYTFAFLLTDVARKQITTIMSTVMFPAYSSIQHDKQQVKHLFIRAAWFNSVIIYPVMGLLLVYTEGLLTIGFGDKWLGAVEVIQLLTLAVVANTFVSSYGALFRGLGLVKLEFNIQLFRALILFAPFLYLGLLHFGIRGAAWAVVFQQTAIIPLVMFYLKRHLSLTYSDLFKVIGPVLLAFTGSVVSGLLVQTLLTGVITQVIFGSMVMLLSYAGTLYVLDREKMTDLLMSVIGLIRKQQTKN